MGFRAELADVRPGSLAHLHGKMSEAVEAIAADGR